MNAEQYKSITGLDNYEGFKSNLKNGMVTRRFGCDDNTIVFNSVRTISQSAYTINLLSNQVAVFLNGNTTPMSMGGTSFDNVYGYRDINGTFSYGTLKSTILKGTLAVNQIVLDAYYTGIPMTITYAIFDLY